MRRYCTRHTVLFFEVHWGNFRAYILVSVDVRNILGKGTKMFSGVVNVNARFTKNFFAFISITITDGELVPKAKLLVIL